MIYRARPVGWICHEIFVSEFDGQMWGYGDVDGMFNDGHDISCPHEGIDDWRE